MKNYLYRITALTLAIALLVAVTAGCRGGDGDGVPEFVFVPEIAPLSSLAGNFPNMHNITITDSAIYFTSISNMSGTSLFRTTQIVRVDLDMSDIRNISNHSSLPNYTLPPPPQEAEGGGVFINAMHTDNEGNLWVSENSVYMTFDFPSNFDVSSADDIKLREYQRFLEPTVGTLRKLDSTGAEILSVDIGPLASSVHNWSGIITFYADDEGNIIIGSGQTIYVLDTDGNTQFSLATDEFIYHDSFIRLSDGRVAHRAWSGGRPSSSLRVLDIDSKAWGDTIELSPDASGIFHGNDEYLAFFNNRSQLMAIDKATGETVQILDWVAAGIEPAEIGNVHVLSGDLILLTRARLRSDATGQLSSRTDLAAIRKVPYDEVQEKTVITIVSYVPSVFTDAVMEFNETNHLYRIEIIELDFNWRESRSDFDKLALEMMTGGGPDIIHTLYFPVHQWAARGYFVDLYELINADPRLARSDFMESVLRVSETNGKLYQMFPDFSISTLIGHPDVVGSSPGWTLDEFMAVIDANPQASSPLGRHGGSSLLYSLIYNDITRFVDWENGNVFFDNDYFIGLLEFAFELESRNYIRLDGNDQVFHLVSSGEQIMEFLSFYNFASYIAYQQLFGGDFIFKGYPTETGSGNSLSTRSGMAITSTSKNKEGAWEFIRMFLSEEWQIERMQGLFSNGIPTNRNVFEQSLAGAMEDGQFGSIGIGDLTVPRKPLIQEDTEKIRALVDSISLTDTFTDPLQDIIFENTLEFFGGILTAQDAARIIQSRASIFVAEQSR